MNDFENVEFFQTQTEGDSQSDLDSSPLSSSSSSSSSAATQQAPDDGPILEAAMDRSSVLSTILSPINLHKDAVVIIRVVSTGMNFIVEDGRVLQASTFISSELFSRYVLCAGRKLPQNFVVTFAVALNPLCECLNLFGTAEPTALKLLLQKQDTDLSLTLTQSGVVAQVQLRALDTDGPTQFYFRHPQNPIRNSLIIQSEHLKAAFAELDWSNSDIQVVVSPEEPYFRLATVGPAGSCEVEFSRDSATIQDFKSSETQTLYYKLKYLQPAIKSLSIAKKTQIRINQAGTMSLMHLIEPEDGQAFFIDFTLLQTDDPVS